jgi:bifunctional UDP-N-acetylglucosamine 2-epimerase / N-acetylmannosamine kinase
MTRKVCVVITARPSYSRVRSALEAIVDHPDLELQLVVASSALLDRYGNAVSQIEGDGFTIAERVYTVIEGENPTMMAKSTGLGLLELSTVLDNLRPDVVVTIADRYETIATAIAAAYQNIPLAHLQGGEITGSIDEKVRHAVTKLADLHLVSTDLAAERVLRMGESPAAIHVTGCPSIDLAAGILDDPGLDFDPIERYGGVGEQLDLRDGYLVVMQHPVTTEYGQARHDVLETLHAVSDIGVPALWFWPNPDAGTDGTSNGIRSFRELAGPHRLHFFKNMAPTDFLRLAYNSRAIVGNSSVAIRECSYLGVPAVNIGTRQQGRERGANVVDVGYERAAIVDSIGERMAAVRRVGDHLYGDGKAGQRIADILAEAPLHTSKRLTY